VVIGAWWGDATNLRSLFVGVRKGDSWYYAGKVGTAISARRSQARAAASEEAEDRPESLHRANAPRGKSDIHWVKPELVAEVKFAG